MRSANRDLIDRLHAHGLRVLQGTLTPTGGYADALPMMGNAVPLDQLADPACS